MVWHGVNGEWAKEITFQASGVSEIRFGPCGHNFATLSTTSWALNRETEILLFCHGRWINYTWKIHQVHFSREGQRVIAIPRMDAVVVCGRDGEKMHEQVTLPHPVEVESARFNADGRYVFTLCKDNTVNIWAVAGWKNSDSA